jgi:tetratricopeptide (TPR) repeat protein
LTEHIERLAHHAFHGEDWKKAVGFLREAGAKALARSANREAAASFRRAADALTRLPRDRETTELAIDVRLDLYQALVPIDELRSLLDDLRAAAMLAEELGDRRRLGLARLHTSHVLILIDDTRASVRLAQDVVAIAEALGDETMASRARLWVGCGFYALGRHRSAVEFVRKSNMPEPGDARRFIRQSGYLSMFLAELGEFGEAERAADVTIASPLTSPERPWNFSNACWQIGWFWCLKGDFGRALPLAERAVAIHRQWSFRRSFSGSAALLGHLYALGGRVSEGVDLLEEAVREGDTFEAMWLRCPRLTFLGEAYLLAGRVEQAKETIDFVLSLARDRGERGFEAWTVRLEGEAAKASARYDDAYALYQAALALATELEMRPLVAHCHVGLANVLQRLEKGPEGQNHFAIATAMYREMGMTYWLEKAETETTQLRR